MGQGLLRATGFSVIRPCFLLDQRTPDHMSLGTGGFPGIHMVGDPNEMHVWLGVSHRCFQKAFVATLTHMLQEKKADCHVVRAPDSL